MKLKGILAAIVIIVVFMSGCTSTYVINRKAQDVKQERPDENAVNYRLNFSVEHTAYNKNGDEAAFLNVLDEPDQNSKYQSQEKVKFAMKKEVINIFNRNKLYLAETFRSGYGDYYLDINLRTRRTYNMSGCTGGLLLWPTVFIPFPYLNSEWNFFLNLDVYDVRPTGSARPVAMYEYKRIVRQRTSNFLFYLGAIPLMFWGNHNMEDGVTDAMHDMLLEFTRDVKAGKLGNISKKSDIFDEVK